MTTILTDPASIPSDVAATDPQPVALSGASTTFPSVDGRPGQLLPAEDLENPPFLPVPAHRHIANGGVR